MHPPPPRRIIPERLWSSLGATGAIPLDAHPLRPGLGAPPGAVDVSGRGLRASRPPDLPRGPRSGRHVGRLITTAAAVAQAPERDPPAGIRVPFRPRRASSDPPCGGRSGQDYPSSRFVRPPLRQTAGAGLRTRPRDDPPRNLLAPAEATTPPPSSSYASVAHLRSNSRQADGSWHAQHDDRTAPRPPSSPVGGGGGGVRDALPSTLGWRCRDISQSTSSPPA